MKNIELQNWPKSFDDKIDVKISFRVNGYLNVFADVDALRVLKAAEDGWIELRLFPEEIGTRLIDYENGLSSASHDKTR